MKRYCLKPEAKDDFKNVFESFGITLLFLIAVFGCISLTMVLLDGYPVNIFTKIFGYIGIISWTALFSSIGIGTKRWLSSNIIKC